MNGSSSPSGNRKKSNGETDVDSIRVCVRIRPDKTQNPPAKSSEKLLKVLPKAEGSSVAKILSFNDSIYEFDAIFEGDSDNKLVYQQSGAKEVVQVS